MTKKVFVVVKVYSSLFSDGFYMTESRYSSAVIAWREGKYWKVHAEKGWIPLYIAIRYGNKVIKVKG